MARIELRNSVIRIVDGYANTADINFAGDYSGGETSIAFDTLGTSELVLEQTRLTIVGSSIVYQVTSDHGSAVWTVDIGAASGGTWAMTFAGQTTGTIAYNASAATVLAALVALSNVVAGDITVTGAGVQTTDPWIISVVETSPVHGQVAVTSTGDGTNLTASDTLTFTVTHLGGFSHDATITPALDFAHVDGAAITFTGRALEINVGDGNLTWSEKKEFNYDLNRGDLDTVREGNSVPVDTSINAVYEFIKAPAGDLTPTFEEVLKQIGRAAAWISSSSDLCEPYAVDIEIVHTPVCSGVDIETTTIPDFRYESLDHDPREATISATGRANVTAATTTRG